MHPLHPPTQETAAVTLGRNGGYHLKPWRRGHASTIELTLLRPIHIMTRNDGFQLPFHTLMTSFTKASLADTWGKVRAGFSHAFATKGEVEAFTSEDLALLERIADAVVKRGMAAPATVFLESLGPMNFLGSQALHFLAPILEFALNVKELEQAARLLERRETISRLISMIEAKSSTKRASDR